MLWTLFTTVSVDKNKFLKTLSQLKPQILSHNQYITFQKKIHNNKASVVINYIHVLHRIPRYPSWQPLEQYPLTKSHGLSFIQWPLQRSLQFSP